MKNKKIDCCLLILLLGLIITFPPLIMPKAVVQNTAFSEPIQINADNYRSYHLNYRSYGPFAARAVVFSENQYSSRTEDLETIRGFDENVVDFRVGFGSITIMEYLLTLPEVERLKNVGVTTLTYNPEGGHTPADEFNRRFNADSTNPIVEFAQFAKAAGLKAVWAPLRADADRTSDAALNVIYQAGIDGIALQEQKFIQSDCVADRISAFDSTISRHENIADRPLEKTVQIMSSRCRDTSGSCSLNGWPRCDAFVDQLAGKIDQLTIWPRGDETDFIRMLRESEVNTSPTPTPPLSCNLKSQGDANCDGTIDMVDFEIWRKEYNGELSSKTADFNSDSKVDLVDFEIWRKNVFGLL